MKSVGPVIICNMDDCDWQEAVALDDIWDWHHKPCPACGRGEVVDDNDLVFLKSARLLQALGLIGIHAAGDEVSDSSVRINSKDIEGLE